ncbi:phytanoyl-CoA dioxygenase [Sphingomonadales bacterium EhC05]|nr:phytanoyl-CoA dioxygenase [Sphingomonadales bacterium EhC05]
MSLQIVRDGAQKFCRAVDPSEFLNILDHLPTDRAGLRLKNIVGLSERLTKSSQIWNIAQKFLGRGALPVRAIYFDKSENNNWSLDWHQDRTIAVTERRDVDGFQNWTIKNNIQHVEPPFELLADMITLRIHLDKVDSANAPLRIALGSHKIGRIPEASYPSVVERCGERVCLADAGDVWVYHTPILHASSLASKPGRRRVLQVDYAARVLPNGLCWAGI